MNNKFLSMLGLGRKAGLICIGHDAVKESVRSNKAHLIILALDSSKRLEKEMYNLNSEITILKTDITIEQFGLSTGKKAGIYSVTDKKFAESLKSKYEEE